MVPVPVLDPILLLVQFLIWSRSGSGPVYSSGYGSDSGHGSGSSSKISSASVLDLILVLKPVSVLDSVTFMVAVCSGPGYVFAL